MRRSLQMNCAVVFTLLTLAVAAAEASDAPAALAPNTGLLPRIVNGTLTADYPSTGALLSPSDPNSAGTVCSGTLIGCQTFLTAGHCVEGDTNPSHYAIFLQHAGFFSVSSIVVHPDFDFPVGDVAVFKLAAPVDGIRPTPIDTTRTPATGTPGTIVGFGRTGGFNADFGIKRAGSVRTATCKNGISNTTSVCWDFTNPLGTPGSNSNTCNGDSGGPLFIDFGAGPTVAGVTSGGNVDDCLPTDSSFDANVYFYRSWIQQQAGADLGATTCGTLPQVGDATTSVRALSGQLPPGGSSGTHSFVVGAGSRRLRVSMNAVDDGSDFDLFVKAGSPPTLSSFDCRQNGRGQYAFCEFTNPAAGTWYVLVDQAAGSGLYQVSATTFGGGCADPGSAGQPCDDGNVCTVNDRCQGGICAGNPAPNGTPCDDSDACTQTDSCQLGTCTGSQQPRTDCRLPFVPGSGVFRLEDETPDEPADADKLTWNWFRGTATAVSDFGDPLSTTTYTLCVFDEASGTPALVLSHQASAAALCGTKPCWKEYAKSFRYTDKKLQNGPISSLLLRQGNDGKAKISLKAKGTQLSLPSLPLHQQNAVTVQLSNGTVCWEGRYSTNKRNNLFGFEAAAD